MRKIRCLSHSTAKISQLTGECDRQRREFASNRTESRFGLVGTDLGVSFEHNNRLYFLFGDTEPLHPDPNLRPPKGDSIASTRDTDPSGGIDLEFITAPGDPKNYLSPLVPGIPRGPFEVPIAGFSANQAMYVFFTTDWNGSNTDPMIGRSLLARSRDNAQSPFKFLYDFSVLARGGKFINVSVVVVNNHEVAGLPDQTGQGLLLWGTGVYRRSDPYLAYLPVNAVEERQAVRYFAGIEAGSHRPIWSAREDDAVALVRHPEIGELSVTWNPDLRIWLLVYNAANPRGINFRVAEKPWGPWSDTALLFDPWLDQGFCHFMHAGWDDRHCDAVHDPGNERVWGGEYGAYVIAPYTRSSRPGVSSIYYVMSTWNPYNTMLMTSTLVAGEGETKTRLAGNPVIVQSRFGSKGNFEVVVPLATNGLAYYWRNNDHPELPWSAPTAFATGAGHFDAVSLIQSNYGTPGNLEIIARQQDRLVWLWREGNPSLAWHGPYPIFTEPGSGACGRNPANGVDGNPVLIQTRFGIQGNFEVIVPLISGGIAHYWRENDVAGVPWRNLPTFGMNAGHIDAVTIIQSNFGSPGDLTVIARRGDRLLFFWRDSGPAFQWNGPFPLIADGHEVTGVTGNPVLVQSKFGRKGDFQLIAPLASGGVAFFFRENDDTTFPWHGPFVFESPIHFEAVTLIQSNFGSPGNLEMVARIGDQLAYSWRDSGPQFAWSGPFDFTAT